MIKLKESGVVYNDEKHTYHLDGKQLKGITGLISKLKCPHKYDDIPPHILEEAARLGTEVHKACELADQMGVELVDDELLDEVSFYAQSREKLGYNHLDNEYTVTDGVTWASNIDCVWTNEAEDVAIADIKTTSHIDEEYLSWQLSIYAYLFEKQNPGIKVSKLFCVLLFKRGRSNTYGRRKCVEIKRKSDEEVIELLSHVNYEEEEVKEVAVVSNEVSIANKIIQGIAQFEREIKALEEKRNELKQTVLQLMEEAGAKSFDCDVLKITYKAPSTRESIDTSRLKKEKPEIYDEYIKKSNVKSGITITLK